MYEAQNIGNIGAACGSMGGVAPGFGGALVGQSQSQQVAQPRDQTRLEAQIGRVFDLGSTLSAALLRAQGIADRLVGAEPQNEDKLKADPGSGNAINNVPQQPPVLVQLERAIIQATIVAHAIHGQLERMQRI